MNYQIIHCPYCGLELHVPEETGKIVCMYCAKPIDLKSLFASTTLEPDGGMRLQHALTALEPSLFRFEKEEPAFTKKDYPTCFAAYSSRLGIALNALHGGTEEDCESFAHAIMSRIADELVTRHVRSSRSGAFFAYRMMITVYLLPVLHDSPVPEASPVLESFLKIWNSRYPEEPLNAVGFDKINTGWRKHGCYITTAVCHSLRKPDNCDELQTLRRFRDSWLLHQPGGHLLVQEYYTFAPTIAEAIDASPSRAQTYRSLWEQAIFPCVQDVHAGRNARCLQRYTCMMLHLERTYLS
ncbi:MULTISPECIES: CFI-box-CTERM domain-containing protein [Caproicibacterium]|jgi:hypothetical protein|uniref:TFIIB-type domain-containing protein n=1 Tax=Caproicibacterium lactatifermentans TaxID=2666138 RepID=A0ABX6PWQ7_9FIRM|nr:CFI-box-CTERM domain-containing protein [Caproicibacterium lactatifermentans]ARP49999.1 hypothetical protein B6259_03355 [Ruminococcaceae bacterium CPB6]MDD4807484.1 hypothetical protein [Oscillospiraceae bacterium]QKO30709.1 hypothetical protein GKP14_06700 [Caproicibacterium lactatifermentans]